MSAGAEAYGEPPLLARELFGSAMDQVRRYAGLLLAEGVSWGLLGPREAPRLWDRHLMNSAALAHFIAPDADVLDVGSGAGLPGIPLHLARPDLGMTLVEPLSRRVRFLKLCQQEVPLPRLGIEALRAQDAHGRLDADVVVVRAVAPVDRLVPMVWPLVRPGGLLLAVKGAHAEAELARWGGTLPDLDVTRPPDVARRNGPDGTVLVTVVRLWRATARAGGSRSRRDGPPHDVRRGRGVARRP